MVKFDWNNRKALTNFTKHGVSFLEAVTVFDDPLAETYVDARHSDQEDRYVTIELSNLARLIFVVHVDDDETIRVVSARKATAGERKEYQDGGH